MTQANLSSRSTPAASPGLFGGSITVLGGFPALAVSAHAAIPFWPVPLTLQTLAILLIGAADALVFGFGLARLAAMVGVDRATAVGLAPFLLGESLKIALAAALVTADRSVLKR